MIRELAKILMAGTFALSLGGGMALAQIATDGDDPTETDTNSEDVDSGEGTQTGDFSESTSGSKLNSPITKDEFADRFGGLGLFEAFDGDEGGLTEAEFNEGYADTGTFAEYDANGDGVVNRMEFVEYNFARYDANDDGVLTDEELATYNGDTAEGGVFYR